MRAFIQRVVQARVTVQSVVHAQIKSGLVVFVGVAQGDTDEDIDFIVNSFRNRALTTNSTLEISDGLVLSVSTDEGLFDPYGLCDIRAEISYRYHLA